MDARSLIEDARRKLSEETGTLHRQGAVRVALCYPSPYHVGMSALGFQTVYRAINSRPDAAAERVFLPDDVEGYRKARVPLFTLESQSEVAGFHALAFSVAYELELPGLFTLLELAGLPVLASERDEGHPLVVAGGPLTFSNPEPLEPFVDLLVQGESEDTLPTLLDALEARLPKRQLLEHLAKVPGFRVPEQSPESSRFYVAKASDVMLPARSQVITANTELRSMFLIEPERGCSRGCHYCVMRRTTNGGMRTVPPEELLPLIPEAARRVGLVGAAVTDHPRIADLLETIVRSGREVGVSSLRADRLSERLVQALKAGGARGLTVASDGASQRLRDLVDRKHSEAQIVRALELAKAAGMQRAKVYNMIGLPTETDADIDELGRFTVELSKILPLSLGVAPFAAKRNTPMDGAPFAGIEVIEHRLQRLKRALKGRAEVRPTSARWAWVEYLLAQSGPEGGLAALDAWRAGGAFAAWKRAFSERGVRPFLARRTVDGRRNSVTWPQVA
jgi:radical SAM superfamily enzyme YgiQ (UPF0313 family)